jgi:hypothetical protein
MLTHQDGRHDQPVWILKYCCSPHRQTYCSYELNCLITRPYRIKVVPVQGMWGNGGKIPLIINLGTRWDEWSASRLDHFTHKERVSLRIEWEGGWALEPFWTLRRRGKYLATVNVRTTNVLLSIWYSNHYSYWATLPDTLAVDHINSPLLLISSCTFFFIFSFFSLSSALPCQCFCVFFSALTLSYFVLLYTPHIALSRCAPRIFRWGGGGLTVMLYKICFILKIMLQKSCCKYNITLFATAFIYIQI